VPPHALAPSLTESSSLTRSMWSVEAGLRERVRLRRLLEPLFVARR
jgi:hypothetical protein